MATPNLKIPDLSPQDVSRFWSKVSRGKPDECWPWTAAMFKQNYGAFKAKGCNLRSNRVAYFIATGEDPGEMLVCHQCDNPPCCNPAHLFLGDNQENTIDCRDKGRLKPLRGDAHGLRRHPEAVQRGDGHWSRRRPELAAKGEHNGAAKFTPDVVRQIRAEYAFGGTSHSALARKHGVCSEAIRKIITRRTWQHVA